VPEEFQRLITLPSGGTVMFRDPEDLTGHDHRKVMNGIGSMDREVAAAMDMVYGVACMLIESWEIPYLPNLVLPSINPLALGDLRLRDYNAIINAVGPAAALFLPAEPSPDDAGKPGSPTVPASD
jgi:hypothetical protein